MKRKQVFTILFLFFVSGLLTGCGEKIDPGNTVSDDSGVVNVRVAQASVSSEPFIYEAVGTVTARTASTLSSQLMGTVKSVRVNEGAHVKKGDVLLILDQGQVSARLHQAEAALAGARRAEASARSARDAAKAGAELAQSTYERYLQLMKDNSVSQQEFDEVAARRQQARAALTQTTAMLQAAGHGVQKARAAVDSARISRKDATILAPYDGIVTAKMVEEGDLASPGTPFFTLEKAGAYCADLVLPEGHIESITLDQQVHVAIPALGEKSLMGRIGRIVPAADQKSRSFMVKVALPEDSRIRSGMFARIDIPIGKAGMLIIPDSAVMRRGQLTGIYLLDSEGKARFRLIRTGKHIGDSVEVISGMRAGDKYVVSPPPAMVDGARVEVSS